jgi:asparagine synthase (glutamine-hydrolysing)
MSARMKKRGPDSEGAWFDERAGLVLGHRRLSIIDVDPRSDQPMASSDGRYVIVFNGEIYNYRELRAPLLEKGINFRTEGDAEVILELFRSKGAAALAMLRGMFALAIWDIETRKLFLARDPYGIKPLYVARGSRGTLFASQVKALLETGEVSRAADPSGVAGFYLWGSVPEPFTIYRDIQSVPAGSYMVVDDKGAGAAMRYADVGSAWRPAAKREGDIAEYVRGALADSVRAHLVSDVPVAVLLSGGIDSSAIAGLMAEQGQAIEGITVSFDEFAGRHEDEGPRARAIADFYGIESIVRRVDRAEFERDLPAILDAMDQPSVDGVNTWFASKAVAERGYKVVLSGVGGDEIFSGYDTFRTVPQLHRAARFLPRGRALRGIAGALSYIGARLLDQPKLADMASLAGDFEGAYLLRRGLIMPGELGQVMDGDAAREGLERLAAAAPMAEQGALPAIAHVAALESTCYLRNQLLRDSDWASMAHSLELRTPLIDWQLLQRLGPHVGEIAAAGGKALLANAPRKSLPAEVISAKKTGFGLPMEAWLGDRLPLRTALPRSMRTRWARHWAAIVAEEFGFAKPASARAAASVA